MPHSQKVCNANQIFQLYQGIDISTKRGRLKCTPGSAAAATCLCERTRYRKQASTVRNMRAVRKTGSWGTRRIFGSIRCKKQAFPVQKRYSVPKTASSGTRRIFKGPQNSRLHKLWTAYCRGGSRFSARNGPALFVRSGDPFPCSFDGTRDPKRPPLGGEQA